MVPAVIMVFVWGCVHFAAGAPLQARIVDQAKGAPNLASTLNQGAFNLGNALGASLGGIMLTEGIGYQYLSLGKRCSRQRRAAGRARRIAGGAERKRRRGKKSDGVGLSAFVPLMAKVSPEGTAELSPGRRPGWI